MSEHQIYLILTLLAIVAGNGLPEGFLRGLVYAHAGLFFFISAMSTASMRAFISGLTGWDL